jgi:restriction endonuclease Mrr
MAILDDLSGFEFEDLMEDVFRNLGYENVRRAERSADKGRDIIMEAVVDGTRRSIIVECKHTDTVGRPVIQKLHSAIATFEFDGPKHGTVVTTGRFTDPAQEYAQRLRQSEDPHPIELIDGQDLRRIADEIGLDLYNGRIEILCDETLRPHDPTASVATPVEELFRDIENIAAAELPEPHTQAVFSPAVAITADTNAVFETTVGVVHQIDNRTRLVIHAKRGAPQVADDEVATLVAENLNSVVELDTERFKRMFDSVEKRRFGRTQTEYKEWAVDQLRQYHTTTVTYTGDNNVTYNRTCEPNLSDISVRSIEPVYIPKLRQTTELGEYSYPYEYYAAGPSQVTVENGICRCVHCETSGDEGTYTYCPNCGAIACDDHSKTERLENTPVCTGCAVTERFALKRKYFYTEQNLRTFREEYAQMPIQERAMENRPLVGGGIVTMVLVVLGLLVSFGVI